MISFLVVMALAFIQNVSFSLVSRSRNRDHAGYLVATSVFSNLVWFLCMKLLILSDMSLLILPSYVIGATAGSLFGARLSMKIEKILGASSDAHLSK